MDIALRKDLIEIQETIANPPAERSARQKATRRQFARPASSDRHSDRVGGTRSRKPARQLMLLEPETSQAACSTASGNGNHLHQQKGQELFLSQLELRFGCQQRRRQLRARPTQSPSLARPERELAVDVVPTSSSGAHRAARAASTDASGQSPRWLLSRLPDSRPDALAMLAGRVGPPPKQANSASSPPVANELDVIIARQPTGQSGRTAGAGLAAVPRAAVGGSKCGGASRVSARLSNVGGPVSQRRRQRLLGRARLDPRKLSLFQLRSMMRRRGDGTASDKLSQDAQSTKTANNNQIDNDDDNGGASASSPAPKPDQVSYEQGGVLVKGRRFERQQQQVNNQVEATTRAANGSRLLMTKPLASLEDQSQLYAVPRKLTATTGATNNKVSYIIIKSQLS